MRGDMVKFAKYWFFVSFSVVVASEATNKPFTLVIDPGHGGSDRGATHGQLAESQLTLKVALLLADKFKNHSDVKVLLTRSTDTTLPLKDRARLAHQHTADLFVSIHGNSSSDSRAKGAEFYIAHSNGQSPPLFDAHNATPNAEPPIELNNKFVSSVPSADSEKGSQKKKNSALEAILNDVHRKSLLYQSQHLALESFKSWQQSELPSPRAIKQAPFYVINQNPAPSLLVELGFITNPQDSANLISPDRQNAMAQSLYEAIQKYRRSL